MWRVSLDNLLKRMINNNDLIEVAKKQYLRCMFFEYIGN